MTGLSSPPVNLSLLPSPPPPAAYPPVDGEYCFYVLTTKDQKHTYGGVTVNFKRRLKQHNGLIGKNKKGARRTRISKAQGHGDWRPVVILTGFNLAENRRARSFESWFHDQRRSPKPRWNKRKRLPLHRDLTTVRDKNRSVSAVIRRSIALIHALVAQDTKFKNWPLKFTFHLKEAQPANFRELFPSTCTLTAD